MKTNVRKIIACLMAMIMTLLIPLTSVGSDRFLPMMKANAAGGVKAKLDSVISTYPSGSRWTGSFDGAIQCYGFAGLVIYNIFGKSTVAGKTYRWWSYEGVSTSGMNVIGYITNYSASNVKNLLSNAKPGDVLQFNTTKQHSMIVYSVESDGVWIYDCNWDNNCGISLRKCSFGAWSGRNSSKLTLLRSDNYSSIDGSSVGQPGTPVLKVSESNVSTKSVVFTWNATSNTDHYDLRVYNYGDYNTGAPYGAWGLKQNVTTYSLSLSAGKYSAYITAYASDGSWEGSEWIDFVVVDPPSTPTLKATLSPMLVDGVTFTWNSTTNTDHYDLRVYNYGDYNTGAPYGAWGLKQNVTSYSIALPAGKYSAYITSCASNGYWVGSQWIDFTVSEPEIDTNFPKNIMSYKMWIGAETTRVFDTQTLKSTYISDDEFTICEVYKNNWAKVKTNDGKTYYYPHIIEYPVTMETAYCKTNTKTYTRYTCEVKRHILNKDDKVTIVGEYTGGLGYKTQVLYTNNNINYLAWVLPDSLSLHPSTGHSYTAKITTPATCTSEGIMTYTCSCGDSYTERISTTGHRYGDWSITKKATCTETGSKEKICSKCNDVITETISKTEHTVVIDTAVVPTCTATGLTEGSHCSVCGTVIKARTIIKATGHTYTSKVTKNANCTATGIKTFTCSKCSDTYTETIAKTVHKVVTDNAVAATCTRAGKTEGSHCSVCGTVIKSQTTVKATGHTYNSIVTKNATCTATGVKTFTCSKCSDTYTETIAKIAHKAVNDKAVAATCTKAGKTEGSHCSACGTIIKAQTTVNATGHKTKTTTTKATTSKAGKAVTKCTVCGKTTKTETIAKVSTIKLSATSYTYDGKAKKPTVTVKDSSGKKLKNGTDYTVTYASGRKNIGSYTVKVTLKGKYKGTKTLTFKIVPATPTLKVTAGSKKATLSWKKITGATGYQIYMATSKNGTYKKIATIKKASTVKYTKTGLTKGKTYYFKVRAYKTVSKTTVYSTYSSVKSVKVK